ncbi:MAG TPA: sugar ABC transporter ATP-binding protein [Alphaproteobacteria bacterium]|nr:sugar ABC transporter ATP-binding protein [Alphaproteobacteria bacterium]
MRATAPIVPVQVSGVTKIYGSNTALRDVDLDMKAGEVLALLGTNGAGKSTLVKIISGAVRPNRGTVAVDGVPVTFRSPQEARAAGIHTVHQSIDDGVVPDLSVAENLVLDELCAPGAGVVARPRALRRRAERVQSLLGLDLPLAVPASALGQAERQLVAIARALAHEPRLLILDEPTSSLSDAESGRLFGIIDQLRARGVAILYISHRMADIRRLADRVAVLRDARLRQVFEKPLDLEAAVAAMLGRAVDAVANIAAEPGDVAVELRRARLSPDADPFDLALRQGEVVAVTGLIGAGKTELGETLFGMRPLAGGDAIIDGAPWRPRNAGAAIAAGVFMAHEDRASNALVKDFSVIANMTLPFLGSFSKLGLMRFSREQAAAEGQIRDLGILCPSAEANILALSGGNQQKVVLARWLLQPCRLLILDEPFQGVDIAARRDIGRRLRETAGNRATLVLCADPDEAVEVADRILVMRDFTVVGEHDIRGLSHGALIAQMAGVEREAAEARER